MSEAKLAIALSRVSSEEQIKNNSIKRQNQSIINGAERLGVKIPKDGWWSGRQSSKKGTNLGRKDIEEMLAYCKKTKAVKYLLIDRSDRFMRSVKEAIYFEVMFEKLGVKVWYTKDWELNQDRLSSEFMKFSKYFDAEGSNDDRIEQSLGGALTALKEGRYPFPPKPGYLRSLKPGFHIIDPDRGPALQEVLLDIHDKRLTPTQAMKKLNESLFIPEGKSPYKMDKFKRLCTEPYYAGIVECTKQIKYRNGDGLHDPLITIRQHKELLTIFSNRPKFQKGPLKDGNPKYPLNNILSCENCIDSNKGRFVGFDHGNGKTKQVWEKYRCRSCGIYFLRQNVHKKIEDEIDTFQFSQVSKSLVIEALQDIWKREVVEIKQQISRTNAKIISLQDNVRATARTAVKPENALVRDELFKDIEADKLEITSLEQALGNLENKVESDQSDFLEFAYNFIETLGQNFLELTKEERLKCKQIMFPSGFMINADGRVYTPEISPLITLASKKKDTEVSDNSSIVRVQGL